MSFATVSLDSVGASTLLDVREVTEYMVGHFENAINIPLSKLSSNTDVLRDVDLNKSYVIYCVKGLRAAKFAEIMQKYGFKNINLLDRGYA